MNIQVTSVSKKEQTLSKSGAAIYVITSEDIRRSGATNIPDLLRMVPGVDVARIDANSWAIGIRGFSDLYSDKVLVLVDGRSVYKTTNSGVNWDEVDMPLEDVDRIEVIRGPGGTVWGANAMNGVINVITKKARDTQGGLVTTGTGSEAYGDGTAQYGGTIGSKGTYRAYARYFDIGSSGSLVATKAHDAWHGFHEGFRSDWDLSPRDTLTVQGDALHNTEGQTLPGIVYVDAPFPPQIVQDRIDYTGGNVLTRWNRTLANGSDMSLQVYDAYYSRFASGLSQTSNTFDLDFQHHLAIGSRHDLVWGLGSRVSSDQFSPGYQVDFLPHHRTDSLFSAFVQDEMKITSSLSFVLGAKFEHNAYTGYEDEPSAQLVWEPTKRQTLWASAAKAIRQPSRRDLGIVADLTSFPLDSGGFGILQLVGNPNPKTEQLRDLEFGYRAQINKRLSFDAVGFSSFYRHVLSLEPQVPYFALSPGPPHLVTPLMFGYDAHAHNYGAEISSTWNVTDRWRLSPSLTLLRLNVFEDPSRQGHSNETPGNNPDRKVQVGSQLNLPRHFEWDASVSYIGRLNTIPSYTRVDTRFGWRLGEFIEFSVVGQNLLSPQHPEFPDSWGIGHTQVERSVFGRGTWRF